MPSPIDPIFVVSIYATQQPFFLLKDDNTRVVFSCNYFAKVVGSIQITWESYIAAILESESIAINGETMFTSPLRVLPIPRDGEDDIPYITIVSTSGMGAEHSHNGTFISQPTFQVLVRSMDYRLCSETSIKIWNVLNNRTNFSVSPLTN